MKNFILFLLLILNCFNLFSQIVKKVETSNIVTVSKVILDYHNIKNNKQGKGISLTPSIGLSFLESKYLELGILFELKNIGYREKLPFSFISNNEPTLAFYTSEEKVNFISFGPKINPKYKINKNFVFFMSLNPFINYLTYATNTLDILRISYKNDYNKFIPSLNYGMGLSVKISKNIILYTEISFDYYFIKIIDNDNINIKISSNNFKIGFQFLLPAQDKKQKKEENNE